MADRAESNRLVKGAIGWHRYFHEARRFHLFDAGDKENVEAAVQEALDWSRNRLAKKEDFETKQKELEGVVNPILTKVYSKHFA